MRHLHNVNKASLPPQRSSSLPRRPDNVERCIQRLAATMENWRAANGALQGVARAIEKTARRIIVVAWCRGEIWSVVRWLVQMQASEVVAASGWRLRQK